jgi:signal transduction histidine kinase
VALGRATCLARQSLVAVLGALEMKLTAKIAAVLVLGFSLVLGLYARSQIEDASAQFAADMREDTRAVGRLFRPMIARTWRKEGRAAAMYLIQYTNETLKSENVDTKMRIRWISLGPEGAGEGGSAVAAAVQEVAAGREVSVVVPGADGLGRLVTYVPVDVGIDGESPGAIEISESLAPLRDFEIRTRANLIETTLILAGIAAIIVLVVGTWYVGRPLRRLNVVAERIGAGDLGARAELRQRDEVGALAATLNSTAYKLASAREALAAEVDARVKALEQLRHADRLSSVGTLAAGVAHELGTPLSVVAGRAKLIADGTVTGADVHSHAASIAKQADRMAQIIRQLLDFARRRQVTLSEKDLARLVEQTLELLHPMARKRRVTLRLEAPSEPTRAAADGVQLQQVFTNLVMNAVDATAEGGEVDIVVSRERMAPPPSLASRVGPEPRDYACCKVIDRGVGIAKEDLPKVFEPFFTTKPVGQGTGLGLAVSYGIVDDHGGWIEVESELDRGTRFSVYLPLEDGENRTRTHRR